MKRRLGTEFCFVADEFFLLAGKPIPGRSYYEDFPQRENGVGLVRDTLYFLERARAKGRELRAAGTKRVHLVTGESFAPLLRNELPSLAARVPEVTLEMHVAENRLFGRPVTVAGLLGGSDLRRALQGNVQDGDLVLVSGESVSSDGVFLDDITPEDLGGELGVRMEAGWESLFASPEPGESERDAIPGVDSLLVETP
jgi:NifB/MoaA-like Fe-S oxidoreductase